MAAKKEQSGRRCLRSIVAGIIADKLVEDGILDTPIRKGTSSTGEKKIYFFSTAGHYHVISHISLTEKNRHLAELPIWKPTFIPLDAWNNAVTSFKHCYSIKYNVEHFLLPKISPLIESISGEDLASIARQFLLDEGIIGSPVRQMGGNTYYFNDDEIYCIDKDSTQFVYEGRIRSRIFRVMDYTSFNMNVWNKAVKQFEVGMTLLDCAKVFIETELVYHEKPQWSTLDRLIQRIESPEYERTPENPNAATFDRVRVMVCLPHYLFPTWNDLKQAVYDNRKEIGRQVIEKIESDRRFKKYGVPVNILRLSDIILRTDYALEYIFELKV